MNMLGYKIKEVYGNKVRLRVCGLYQHEGSLLMIKHNNLGKNGVLWIPPGGGVEFGMSLEENLEREFAEETGLSVRVGELLFVYEYNEPPLHAVEIFFRIDSVNGTLGIGSDPELPESQQIIEDVKMLRFEEIDLMDRTYLHGIFSQCSKAREVFALRGFFKFKNNA